VHGFLEAEKSIATIARGLQTLASTLRAQIVKARHGMDLQVQERCVAA
jgi:hypothetical protein